MRDALSLWILEISASRSLSMDAVDGAGESMIGDDVVVLVLLIWDLTLVTVFWRHVML